MNTATDSVRIVLFAEDSPLEFAVVSEVDDPENLKLPGGKFDTEDEQPREAAVRELGEELGIAAADIQLQGPIRLIADDGVSLRFIFTANVQRELLQPSAEIARFLWLTVDSIPETKNKQHMLAAVMAAHSIAVVS